MQEDGVEVGVRVLGSVANGILCLMENLKKKKRL